MPCCRHRITGSDPARGVGFVPRCRGVSLVELMTGLALGMLVLTAMAVLFANNSAARGEIERASQQIESGRFALQLLRDEIRLAGYFHDHPGGTRQVVEVCIPRGGVPLSAAALGWQASPPRMPLSLHGYAAGDTPATETCIANQKPDTDVLILRRVESGTMSVAGVAGDGYSNDYFLQVSACADPAVDAPDEPTVVAPGGRSAAAAFALHAKDCVTPAPLRRLAVHAYYVGKCSVCSGGGDGVPSLRMVELSGASATNVAVIEGIDSMRIEYALDTDDDGEIDAVKRCSKGADPCSAGDWSRVMGVRVHLLARSLTPSPGHTNTRTYDMGLAGTLAPPNDRYRRHLYGAMVIAYNLAGPRER